MFRKSDPKVPIVYSPGYNITFFGLERLHPFDSQKYRRVHKRLTSQRPIKNPNFLITKPQGMLPPLLRRSQFYTPKMPTAADLSLIHSQSYLDSLACPKNVAGIVEIPILSYLPSPLVRARVLKPMLLATGGSKLAAELALTEGWAINLGGGFHHASRDHGGGFCVYADISLAVRHVLEGVKPEKRVKKVMIVDLDAHQGNGHETDFTDDARVHIYDCFNKEIYPQDSLAENAISTPVVLHSHSTNTSEPRYIERLSETLRPAIESFGPEFILYNAGTDCMRGDPLGEMMLGFDGIVERDEIVFRLAREVARCPVMMVLSGGYQKRNAEVISMSILNLFDKFDLMPKAG